MKIMIVWEMGNGFGHIARLLPIATILKNHGHELVWVVPKLQATSKLPPESVVEITPQFIPPSQIILKTWSLTHILYNMGFENEVELSRVIKEWHVLFDRHSPDIILADYSPSVLIANLSRGLKMFHIGDGFTIPPQEKPYGVFIPASSRLDINGVAQLIDAENRLLAVINKASTPYGGQPISSLSELYGSAPNAALLSFPELDHFGFRDVGYYGVMTDNGNDKLIHYPKHKHILLYIKDFPKIDEFERGILGGKWALSVYISQPELPERFVKKLKRRKNTTVYRGPVNFKRAGEVCDLMISHGNHTTTAQALKEGLPILAIPIDSEKVMVADRVRTMGAGVMCGQQDGHNISKIINHVLSTPSFKQNAQAFKQRYNSFDAQDSLIQLVNRIERVMEQ